MKQSAKSLKTITVATILAVSFGVQATSLVWAAPGDINSVNNGSNPSAGQYYNTSDSQTVFQNGSSGITFNGNYRFLESTNTGTLTGNGGRATINTSGMVRLNGSLDASGLMKNGVFTGNGGNITINAPYFLQNGGIFANGLSGGSVNINVGSMTATAGSKIYAKGFGENGGSVRVKAAGVVDIQQGAIIDTSGKTLAGYDTNLINIQGGMVNVDGVLVANALAAQDASVASEVNLVWDSECGGPETAGASAGTIQLAATGTCTDCVEQTVNQAAANGVITSAESQALLARNSALLAQSDGSIVIGKTGVLQANGAHSWVAPTPDIATTLNGYDAHYYKAGDGGTIQMVAANDITIDGTVQANGGEGASGNIPAAGGNGGTISACANDNLTVNGTVQANGGDGGDAHANDVNVVVNGANGGNGGQIAFHYDSMTHNGTIEAKGGKGGQGTSVVDHACEIGSGASATAYAKAGDGGNGGAGGDVFFVGAENPTGSGTVNVNGGQGGLGGDATALAVALSDCDADASATAIAGKGGEGGASGSIHAPKPSSFNMTYSAKDGGNGNAGTATAKAVAVGIGKMNATAIADGNAGSTSSAISAEVVANAGDFNAAQSNLVNALGVGDGSVFSKSGTQIATTVTSTVANSSVNLSDSSQNQGNVVTGQASALSSFQTQPSGSITTGSDGAIIKVDGACDIACLEPPTPFVQPCDPPEEPPPPPTDDPRFFVPPVNPPVFPQANAVNPGIVLVLPPGIQPPVIAMAQPTPDNTDTPQTPGLQRRRTSRCSSCSR